MLVQRRRRVETVAGCRPNQGEDRARLGHVLELHVAAEGVGPEHVREHRVPDGLGVEPEPVVAPEDAHVRPQLALVGQDRCVAPAARLERLDVVRHLPLEEVRRLGAAHEELRAVRAVDQPRRFGDELVVTGGDHATSVLFRQG
jgi:hypothetical protein